MKKSQGVKKAVTFYPACIASIGIAATLLIGFPRISFADGSEIDVLEKSAHISKVITERSENTGVPESSGLIEDSSNLNENLSTTEGEDNEALNFETSSVYPNDGQIYSRLDEGRIGSNYTGWNESGTAWYDNGVMARSHCFYDPGTGAWYWADADGSIAAGKDVFIPKDESDRSKGGKWVRFEADRTMVKGEDFRYGGWYLFDRVTGEMAKGFAVPDGKKWCYYDPVTGKMQYGERAIDGGWYYLTPGTGAVDYEWAWLPGSNKWVYYDAVTGRMVHGPRMVDGKPYYLDDITGRKLGKNEIVEKLFRVVQSSFGTHPDCPVELKSAGGELCPYGPCMSYVWWCFHHAGLDIFLNNDEIRTGWPHQSFDWYKSHGRVNRSASKGDIAFFNPTDWAPALGVSSSHAGIVIGTTSGGLLIADASYGGIMPRLYSWRDIAGIAHPYY